MTTASSRPRLLVLSSTYPRWRGDPEPGFVHELTKRLAAHFEVMVIAPHAPGAAREEVLDGVSICRYRYAPVRWETLVNHGGVLINLRRSRWKWCLLPGFVLAQAWAVRRALHRFKPQAVHAHWLLPQGLIGALIAGRVPLLVTSHGADLFGLRGRLFALVRQWVVSRAAAISVVSGAMRERLLNEAPRTGAARANAGRARIEVLPMGIDAEHLFVPTDDERASDELLFVGRLVEKKGLRHLIAALPAIMVRRRQVGLTIVGFGPEQSTLEQLAYALNVADRVRFLGALKLDDLPPHYRRATLFVAPFVEASSGDQEGLGLVVAEAMACGCPVLVGDVPGVRDLVNERTGVRVAASDHAALAQAVVALLDDRARRSQLALAARAHVLTRFDWSCVAAAYRELLLSLLRRHTP